MFVLKPTQKYSDALPLLKNLSGFWSGPYNSFHRNESSLLYVPANTDRTWRRYSLQNAGADLITLPYNAWHHAWPGRPQVAYQINTYRRTVAQSPRSALSRNFFSVLVSITSGMSRSNSDTALQIDFPSAPASPPPPPARPSSVFASDADEFTRFSLDSVVFFMITIDVRVSSALTAILLLLFHRNPTRRDLESVQVSSS